MTHARALLLAALCLGLAVVSHPAAGQTTDVVIASDQAASYVGQTVTVCGQVASARYLSNTNKRPTFLNLGREYPDHDFSVVIMGEHRAKFPEAPEKSYRGKRICVKGVVRMWHGKPEIEVTEPAQISLDTSAPAAQEPAKP